eukprot:c6633_g1_i1.p1 GENE.c6633_g1_i1~~c6633_g1_i1.p1  ORF type:complete len:450 (-),score=100.72 c6633_g1_i1:30-1379(-)
MLAGVGHEPSGAMPGPGEPQIVRNFVTNMTNRAVNMYSISRDSSPQLAKDGISEIEERLKVLKAPLWSQWQTYGEPLITKADETLAKNILSPVRTMEDHFFRAVHSVTNSPQHVQHIISQAHLASREMLAQHMDRIRTTHAVTAEPSETDTSSFLDRLRDRIFHRIVSYQQIVNESSSQPIRVVLLGVISDYYAYAIKILESYRVKFSELYHAMHQKFGQSQPRLQCSSQSISASVTALTQSIESLFAALRTILLRWGSYSDMDATPFTTPEDHLSLYPETVERDTAEPPAVLMPDTECSWTPSPTSDRDDVSSLISDMSQLTQSSADVIALDSTSHRVHHHVPHVSVLGKGVDGLTAEDAETCLLAVETLRNMLLERKGAPLKQPGLSRKLYVKHTDFKDAINNAGGLRAFVKRFPEEFRIFPGKGTVWFVTLRDGLPPSASELESEE